jgi:hypothetical protein
VAISRVIAYIPALALFPIITFVITVDLDIYIHSFFLLYITFISFLAFPAIIFTMHYVYISIPLTLALGATASMPADHWVFGKSLFYLGPPTGASIMKATYSLVPPDVPSGVKVSSPSDQVWVSVWVGASSTNGDEGANLYQPLLNWSPDQESQYVSDF